MEAWTIARNKAATTDWGPIKDAITNFAMLVCRSPAMDYVNFTLVILLLHWHFFVLHSYETTSPAPFASSFPSEVRFNPLNAFFPHQIACPANAICADGRVAKCEPYDAFKKTLFVQHLLPSFLLPFPLNQPRCVLDRKKLAADSRSARITRWVKEEMDRAVRVYKGEVQCGQRNQTQGNRLGMPVDLARDAVKKAAKLNGLNRYQIGKDTLSSDELHYFVDSFVSSLRDRPETAETDPENPLSVLSETVNTTSASIVSWSCRTRFIRRGLILLAVVGAIIWAHDASLVREAQEAQCRSTKETIRKR